jgi:hypothetical protein
MLSLLILYCEIARKSSLISEGEHGAVMSTTNKVGFNDTTPNATKRYNRLFQIAHDRRKQADELYNSELPDKR